jgi:predicted  nucleic acid-binding Zn-ribbon protein
MQQVHRTNTARIAELERHVTDLQQQMTTGRQELIQLKLFVEERKVINERLRRQLQEYEREHKTMRSVADEVMGVIRPDGQKVYSERGHDAIHSIDNDIPSNSEVQFVVVDNVPSISEVPLIHNK